MATANTTDGVRLLVVTDSITQEAIFWDEMAVIIQPDRFWAKTGNIILRGRSLDKMGIIIRRVVSLDRMVSITLLALSSVKMDATICPVRFLALTVATIPKVHFWVPTADTKSPKDWQKRIAATKAM